MKQYIPKVIGAGINLFSYVDAKSAAKKVLDIFSTPRAGRIKPHHKAFLQSFELERINTTEGSIATYRKPGSGPSIMLCHGWESNSFRWRKLIKYFRDKALDYEIIMMDAPGHGASSGDRFTALKYKEAMKSIYDHYQPNYMVGHSVGGFAMSIFLHEYRAPSLEKVILMAPPDTLELITNNYFKLLGLNDRVKGAYYRLIPELFGNPVSYYNASDFIKSVDLPGLLIHDIEDEINFHFEGKSIVDSWQRGELYSTSGLGHSLQSVEVFKSIADYLD